MTRHVVVPLLSTGDESTLGNYQRLAAAAFGADSAPVRFLDRKIADSPNGADELVLADERQMLQVLGDMYLKELDGEEVGDGSVD